MTSFHDTDTPLFTGDELAELRRIERDERERERLRLAGERLAARTRRRQQLPEHVEVELWEP